MGRLMRLLMMFGPMLFRMYNKWSAKRARQSVEQPQAQAHNEQMPNEGEVDVKYKDKDVKYDDDEFV